MSDLIDRWAVVDAIKDADVCVRYPENESVEIENVIELAIRATKGSVIASIEQLPSAQPEELSCDECKFCGQFEYQFPCKVCIRMEKDYYARLD